MKADIIKIWVCQDCGKEFIERQIMCSICNKFEFGVKYGGQISDAEELTKLIESYKKDDIARERRLRM